MLKMNSLFKKLAFRISILFFIVILVLCIASIVYLDRTYKENTKQALLHQAQVVDHMLLDKTDIAAVTNEVLGQRVTIIDLSGNVLLDTQADVDTLDNHLSRPEIKEAIKSGSGVNVRYSDTLEKDLMYAAIFSEQHQVIIRVALSLEGIAAYSAGLWMPLVIVLTVSFFLCLLVVLLISRSITKPLIQLKNDTQMIARGQYDDIRTLQTGDEIETLSGALVDMAQTLKQSFSSITEKNSRLQAVFMAVPGGILAVDNDEKVIMANPTARKMFSILGKPEGKHFMDVVQNPHLESVIKEAVGAQGVVEKDLSLLRGMEEIFLQVFAVSVVNNGKTYGVILLAQDITRIRKLESLRSDFAANVSHELKTPLTVISGFIDTLKDPDISAQDAARFFDIISLESERLTRLIDDVLVLSDIENTAAMPAPMIDIRKGISDAVQLLEPSAKDKNVELTLDMSEQDMRVMADMDRIKQMVINLVDNAIKYTPQDGKVDVSAAKVGHHAVITIEDTGIGIPAENIPRLFERFYRVDKSRSRALGGTGLGLAIVKHIVNLIGGHITVRSNVGEGTRFDVFLPIGGKGDKND